MVQRLRRLFAICTHHHPSDSRQPMFSAARPGRQFYSHRPFFSSFIQSRSRRRLMAACRPADGQRLNKRIEERGRAEGSEREGEHKKYMFRTHSADGRTDRQCRCAGKARRNQFSLERRISSPPRPSEAEEERQSETIIVLGHFEGTN